MADQHFGATEPESPDSYPDFEDDPLGFSAYEDSDPEFYDDDLDFGFHDYYEWPADEQQFSLSTRLNYRIREFIRWLPIKISRWIDRNILWRFEPILCRARRCRDCGKRGVMPYSRYCPSCMNYSGGRY